MKTVHVMISALLVIAILWLTWYMFHSWLEGAALRH